MYAADHISAVRRNFESRAMPETEKPPAGPVDIYFDSGQDKITNLYYVSKPSNKSLTNAE